MTTWNIQTFGETAAELEPRLYCIANTILQEASDIINIVELKDPVAIQMLALTLNELIQQNNPGSEDYLTYYISPPSDTATPNNNTHFSEYYGVIIKDVNVTPIKAIQVCKTYEPLFLEPSDLGVLNTLGTAPTYTDIVDGEECTVNVIPLFKPANTYFGGGRPPAIYIMGNIAICVCHLRPYEPTALSQSRQLSKMIKDSPIPFIVTGDFNIKFENIDKQGSKAFKFSQVYNDIDYEVDFGASSSSHLSNHLFDNFVVSDKIAVDATRNSIIDLDYILENHIAQLDEALCLKNLAERIEARKYLNRNKANLPILEAKWDLEYHLVQLFFANNCTLSTVAEERKIQIKSLSYFASDHYPVTIEFTAEFS